MTEQVGAWRRGTVRLGTRASALAVRQTEEVLAGLRAAHPGLAFEVRPVRTAGDHDQATPLADLGGEGVFVTALENALLAGEIDLAIHSLKDMPAEQPPGLAIGAVLPRADPREALVSRLGLPLEGLPAGGRVGTDSPRRAAQLRAFRPDLQVIGLRGNVDTRLRKARSDEYDAIVLALAGLIRLGQAAAVTAIIPPEIILPAPGQGGIAVEVRAGDGEALELAAALDDAPTRAATTAERSFLQALGAGCHVPVAAHARRLENKPVFRSRHPARGCVQRVTFGHLAEPGLIIQADGEVGRAEFMAHAAGDRTIG